MNLYNLLVNIVVAAIFVVILFWALGMFAAGLPVMAVTLIKLAVILIAIGYVFGFFGSTITLR